MNRAFDFFNVPDLFRLEYVNAGLFAASIKSPLQLRMDHLMDLEQFAANIDLDQIADNDPDMSEETTSSSEAEQ